MYICTPLSAASIAASGQVERQALLGWELGVARATQDRRSWERAIVDRLQGLRGMVDWKHPAKVRKAFLKASFTMPKHANLLKHPYPRAIRLDSGAGGAVDDGLRAVN